MIKVRVPATSANLGPGFDYVGMALELYNDFYFLEDTNEHIPGGSIFLNSNSLTHQAYGLLADKIKKKMSPPKIAIHSGIPRARGLGSSASLTVAGLVAGNIISNAGLDQDELIELATRLEGHPDNAVPALLGGLVVCMTASGRVRYLKFMPQKPLQVVVAVPEFELPTSDSRKVLPSEVSHRDAVQNTGRFGFFIAAMLTGDYRHLSFAMEDLLHQPYRSHLVPGMKKVMSAALEEGALGSCLSGAGPSILALCDTKVNQVSEGMKQAWKEHGIKAEIYVLNIAVDGTSCCTSCIS